jgi:predicted phosphohydrolase
MRITICILLVFVISSTYGQTQKDSIFKKDIVPLVEEMEFMYGYDQVMREYTTYQTFDKSETDRIENLADSIKDKEINKRKFVSDTLAIFIFKNYIDPKDAIHTARIIEITKKYGFPSLERIRKYYKKDFIDPEFNPYILLVHAPKVHWTELKELIKTELVEGRISRCVYGHMLWHFNGRKNMKDLLENGFERIKENGVTRLKSTCE